ncbi:hypothetical protein ACWCOT_45240 [Nonomuraea bangladeshensis]
MRRAAKALLPLSREFCQPDKDRAQRPGPDATPPGDDRRQCWTALDPRAFDRIDARSPADPAVRSYGRAA